MSTNSDPLQKIQQQQQPPLPSSPSKQHAPNALHPDGDLSFSDLGSFSDIFEHFADDDDSMSAFASTAVAQAGAAAATATADPVQSSSYSNNAGAGAAESSEPTTTNDSSTNNNNTTITSNNNNTNSRKTIPNKNDVLLGRGGRNNQHSGNEQLRRLAREMSHTYSAAPKRNKPSLAWLLVTKIRGLSPMGRCVIIEYNVSCVYCFRVDEFTLIYCLY